MLTANDKKKSLTIFISVCVLMLLGTQGPGQRALDEKGLFGFCLRDAADRTGAALTLLFRVFNIGGTIKDCIVCA